jgi:hypothetical protein
VITSGEGLTLSTVLFVMPLKDAEIVLVPGETDVAKPAELIVATAVVDDLQVTTGVKLLVLLSE